jgi:hypothetical protein
MHPTDPAVAAAERGAVVPQEETKKKKRRRRRRRKQPRGPPPEDDCFTIAEFCARHKFTRQFYHELRKLGLTPREIRLGTRVLISREAAIQWRREREAATAATTATAATA